MKQTLRSWMMAILFAATIGGGVAVVATPQPVQAQDACGDRLLTLPAWFRGLTDENCNIKSPSDLSTSGDPSAGLSIFIWTIVLNIIEMVMQIVGYITIAFLIYGGFKYMTSQGEASNIMKAKDTIRNALIGLLIAIFSIALVNFIAGAIT
jgi:hypothetical protein